MRQVRVSWRLGVAAAIAVYEPGPFMHFWNVWLEKK